MPGTVLAETYSSVKKVPFVWQTDSTADVELTTRPEDASFNGEILLLITTPGTGLEIPRDGTNTYDVRILDEDLHDVLCEAGLYRDPTITEYVQPVYLGVVANDRLTLQVSRHSGDTGDTRSGTVTIFIR